MICGVSESFSLSREMVPVKNPEEVGLQTGWRNIVSFARILAGRFVFSFQCRGSFSPSRDPLHFQQFLLDSISAYVSRLSHM